MTLYPPQYYRKTRGIIRRGLSADKPLASDVLEGTLYFSTDTATLERSNGLIWQTYAPSASSTPPTVQQVPFVVEAEEQQESLFPLRENQYDKGITQLTGDVTAGPGNGSQAATLANTAVTPASYVNTSLTVDSKGRITAASSGTAGNITSTGVVGSEPGSPASGDLYLTNNGFNVERYSGSAWAPWGPIWPLTAPISGDFSWVNQETATISTTNGGVYFYIPAVAGTHFRMRTKSKTGTFSITAAFLWAGPIVDFNQFGLCWRKNSTGQFITCGIACVASISAFPVYISQKFTNPTTFSGNYLTSANNKLALNGLIWLRIADDGTNRIFSYSPDGYNFLALHTVGRTDFITADEVGIFAETENSVVDLAFTEISWKEA